MKTARYFTRMAESVNRRDAALDLSDLGISNDDFDKTVSKELIRSPWIKYLNLSKNKLTEFPESLTTIGQLGMLNLGLNPISRIPHSIAQLPRLSSLDLSGCKLSDITPALSGLSHLRTLSLANNSLAEVPQAVAHLTQVSNLDLQGNRLSRLPEFLFELSLTHLNLGDNQLGVLPAGIGNLTTLTSLVLYRTGLETLPDSIGRLQMLSELLLWNNRFTSIPLVTYELKSLVRLSFNNDSTTARTRDNNEIREVPRDILRLSNLTDLSLKDNPVQSPPPEVVAKGIKAIGQYFRQLTAEGKDYLYEAKLLILGEGGAGKTSLGKKILNPRYELVHNEQSTEGIEVFVWRFTGSGGKEYRVNIWDFGGQEIYHSTHQFFLTRRSVYVLVADTRKDDTDFFYWLNIVELLSDNSPLLIVKNEKQERHREISDRQLRAQFDNLKDTLATNLATNRGLAEVVDEIKHYIANLPHMGSPLPKNWVQVRAALDTDRRNFISLDDYLDICEQNGVTEPSDKLQVSGYLHDLGVCLHFQDDVLLRRFVILKPKWGTNAVYGVLDNKNVISNLGRFNKHDLDSIWNASEYDGMRDELLQLMINFRLCYRIPNTTWFIAPQLLSENEPRYEWDDRASLVVRYTYEFLPKGILTQLIVAMHPWIYENKVWKSGVLIAREGARAEIVEYYSRREIQVRVSGSQRKDLLAIVMYEMDKIHATFNRIAYKKLVPCHCGDCERDASPFYYPLEMLQKFLDDGQTSIQCHKSYESVDVRQLLDVVLAEVPTEEGKTICFSGNIASVIIQQSSTGRDAADTKPGVTINPKSAWASGSFYLFAVVCVVCLLGALARYVPWYVLPMVLVAGLLFTSVIGALQMRHDDKLSEKTLVQLMKVTLGQLPLIRKLQMGIHPDTRSRQRTAGK